MSISNFNYKLFNSIRDYAINNNNYLFETSFDNDFELFINNLKETLQINESDEGLDLYLLYNLRYLLGFMISNKESIKYNNYKNDDIHKLFLYSFENHINNISKGKLDINFYLQNIDDEFFKTLKDCLQIIRVENIILSLWTTDDDDLIVLHIDGIIEELLYDYKKEPFIKDTADLIKLIVETRKDYVPLANEVDDLLMNAKENKDKINELQPKVEEYEKNVHNKVILFFANLIGFKLKKINQTNN